MKKGLRKINALKIARLDLNYNHREINYNFMNNCIFKSQILKCVPAAAESISFLIMRLLQSALKINNQPTSIGGNLWMWVD